MFYYLDYNGVIVKVKLESVKVKISDVLTEF